jgi:hypothetical protein
MQGWVIAGAWLFAVVLALVVLGFATYEVSWKMRRLQRDRASLSQLMTELTAVAAHFQAQGDRARTMTSAMGAAGTRVPTRSAEG